MEFEAGRCYVLLGENGAGKSTLLRILAGLLRPSFGKVTVFGEDEPHEARERIGYMSHAPMLYDELTAQENLRYFASLYPDRACLAPAEALRQVGLDPELEPPPRPLFAGNAAANLAGPRAASRSRVAAAGRAFLQHGRGSARQMVELLAGFRHGNRTIILTTHQRELAAPIADWVLTLHAGRVASFEPGSPTL